MEESQCCTYQDKKNKIEKSNPRFRVLHECSTKSSVYVWKRCEDCGELRLDKKQPKT